MSRNNEVDILCEREHERQNNTLSLIASESIPWESVRRAYGSWFCTKYAEGYPHARYYGGCEIADKIESLAISNACSAFGAKYANVQPLCGSNANLAVLCALLKPGEKMLGMDLKAGGHLTHGARVSVTGKFFEAHHYGVGEDGLIDYDEVARLAVRVRPRLIIVGFSAYTRVVDFARFKKISDDVDAYLMADIAHVAGLIAGGNYPSPVGIADVITTTTHKTLRGPRGGMIMTDSDELITRINKAVFPGLQGGPFMHSIAAKAAALSEDFTDYSLAVINNARACASAMLEEGIRFVAHTNGCVTDTHMCLVDLRGTGHSGASAQELLERVGVVCNKNCIPGDPGGARNPSGVRIGLTVATNRGFKEEDCRMLGAALGGLICGSRNTDSVRAIVAGLCKKYPL